MENGEADGAAIFAQEYECSFQAALVGSYYGGGDVRAKLLEAARRVS